MSSELRTILDRVVEEGCRKEKLKLEEDMPRYKSILLKVSNLKKLDVLISIEGTKQDNLDTLEGDLNMLQRANLVVGSTKYTHRNVYRDYEITDIGAEIAKKLVMEKQYDAPLQRP